MDRFYAVLVGVAFLIPAHAWGQNISENERLRMENSHLRRLVDSLRHEVRSLKGVTVVSTWEGLRGLEDEDGYDIDYSGFGLSGQKIETAWARSLAGSVPSLGVSYDSILKKYLDFYTITKARQMASILGRYEKYLPGFKSVFARYGVPEDLTALCIVESAVSRKALSKAGALGMWQLMPATARQYGLRVDGTVDERYDIWKSTDAAARLLRDLKKMLGSWTLAVSAYNCGAGNVRKAVVKSGGARDFWTLSEYLPNETQAYLPSLIAARHAWLHAEDYGIHPKRYPADRYDTSSFADDISLSELAGHYGVTESSLVSLNPQFLTGMVPAGCPVMFPYGALSKKR